MTIENILKLPTGNILPVTVVTEKYTEYSTMTLRLTVPAAEKILQRDLIGRLKKMIGYWEITKTAFETACENGVLKVTLKAECLEQIAAERPFTAEELQQALTPTPETNEKK
jgi:similar to stage IV sporulation protein